MSEEQIIARGKEVLKIEAEAILNLQERINGKFAKAANTIYNAKGRIVFTGLGKSGLIARKIVATLNSTGTPSIFLHPTDALHGDLGMVRKEDVIIIISKSGNTDELLNLVTMFKRMGVFLIGMLGGMDSAIGKRCDIILDVSVKEEACPNDLAPTSSTTATLAMGDALAVAVLQLRNFTVEDFALLHPAGSLGKRLSLRIHEIMYSGEDLPLVKENTSLKDTIIEITTKRLGTTCVINSEGKLTGIITDGDLRRLLEHTLEIKNLIAKDVMTGNPKTIDPNLLASIALLQMENYKITSLIAVDENGLPVGLVHLHDLVKLGLQRR
ncbi:arabinose 5-phosphate isomerase KdsD [bacterium BMS3Abin04]|nr:arabinose 5-phosphate isomerase KdsD [bacterium BMS3Abin04]